VTGDPPVRHVTTIFGSKIHYAFIDAGSTFCGARVGLSDYPHSEVDCGNCIKVFEHRRKLAAAGEPHR
jgi:hypothetical protein